MTKNLFVDGIHLITSICNEMKNSLMDMCDKIDLQKHSVIKTVNDKLKISVKLNIQDINQSNFNKIILLLK